MQELLDDSGVTSSDFMHVYNLVSHSERRTPEDYFHRTVMVAFLIKALKKTKYFDDKGNTLGNLCLFLFLFSWCVCAQNNYKWDDETCRLFLF